jgi:hypothetical protein
MNKRLKEIGTCALLVLFGCGIAAVTTMRVGELAGRTEGTVVSHSGGKASSITIATKDDEETLPFDDDDRAVCPQGARFVKEAWSAELRCNGARAPNAGGIAMWVFAIVAGYVVGGLFAWIGWSSLRKELAAERP